MSVLWPIVQHAGGFAVGFVAGVAVVRWRIAKLKADRAALNSGDAAVQWTYDGKLYQATIANLTAIAVEYQEAQDARSAKILGGIYHPLGHPLVISTPEALMPTIIPEPDR